MVGHFNDIKIMFYDENRISSITQLLKKFIQTMHIPRVKTTLGSSNTYITSTRLLLRCLTIFTRCDSPPEIF